MSSRRAIATCCLLGGLVLLVFAVVNASQTPPSTAAAWVEGLLGVALLGLGVLLRKPARPRAHAR